jgi:hypothetical protein
MGNLYDHYCLVLIIFWPLKRAECGFEDLSCDMVFGQILPAIEDEPIYHQPCLMTQCPTAQPGAAACPKVREV